MVNGARLAILRFCDLDFSGCNGWSMVPANGWSMVPGLRFCDSRIKRVCCLVKSPDPLDLSADSNSESDLIRSLPLSVLTPHSSGHLDFSGCVIDRSNCE